jgi:CDP-glucose 4,6-dehydratase
MEIGRRRMEGVVVSKHWQDRRVLVTGATGLVGGWLVRRLLDEGADVVALVRDWVPRSNLLDSHLRDRVDVVRGDLLDQQVLERTMGEYEAQSVFHLAAQTIVGVANRNPGSTFDSNIRGTWQLMEAARRSPTVEDVVFASSDKAYGEQPTLPYSEETPLQGTHPYDVSKSCADLIVQAYAHTYGAPATITRCGNFFGGGDLNWNRIVPGTIRSILRGNAPLIRSDGSFVRDYFYVEDGAEAYMHLSQLTAQNKSLAGEAFNFSYEEPKTVLEVVADVQQAMGTNMDPLVKNEASGEIPEQHLDASKARRMLDWSPQVGFHGALERTVAWYRNLLESSA